MTAPRAAALFLALALLGPALVSCLARAEPIPMPPRQIPCGNRHEILDQLRVAHGEGPAGVGLTHNGGVIELLTAASGTWTMLVTMPGGLTCLVASGTEWEPRPGREREL